MYFTSASATASHDAKDSHPCNDRLMGEITPRHKNDHYRTEKGQHQLLAVHPVSPKRVTEDAKELIR
jgi:hypothetical protein